MNRRSFIGSLVGLAMGVIAPLYGVRLDDKSWLQKAEKRFMADLRAHFRQPRASPADLCQFQLTHFSTNDIFNDRRSL